MEIVLYEFDITEYPDGSGRSDKYRVDDTGRYFEGSYELTAAEVALYKRIAPDNEDKDDELQP